MTQRQLNSLLIKPTKLWSACLSTHRLAFTRFSSFNRCNTIIGTRLRKLNAFNFFLTMVSLIFTNMKIYVSKCTFWLILVVLLHFSLPFLFFNLQSKKRKSFNLKISINFGRKLYLNKLSYHTQIGRIWKSKNNSLKWDQSGYGSFIGLDFIVFQRWVNFMVIFQWFW